ncbi:HigA family addiction module antitoxin [Parapedobacter tibetensis]|uniref:HigA family addiction module antitoxin n=1 Tax=Parapedobacter tibetensis TaxID=2972951 RepID=UPI00214DD13C|nr:HigA family addiction module antitoxin [Parapedobacter tibetensis]
MKRGIEHNTHPGEYLREDIIEANGLTISKAAELLGITRANLSKIVNEHASITPNMAIKISLVFGGKPDFWLRMQLAYDLREAEREAAINPPNVKKFEYA